MEDWVWCSVRQNRKGVHEDYRSWTRVTPKLVSLKPSLDLMSMIPPKWLTSRTRNVPKAFLVYVNGVGKTAMMSKNAAPFPVGSVIVKEKFRADRKIDMKKLPSPELLTVMKKKASGWEYSFIEGDKVKRGDTKHCVSCHEAQS